MAQTDLSRAFEVTEGSWVYGSDDGHLSTFRTDITIPIPPEMPVRTFVGGHEAAGGVHVAQHDFDVLSQPWPAYSPRGIMVRLENGPAVEALEGLLLGSIRAAPPPRAEVEGALADICGRCPNCGGQVSSR
jgi:hypothetical protein